MDRRAKDRMSLRSLFRNLFLDLLRDQRGATLVIVSILMPLFFGFTAFAIDMGYAYLTLTRLPVPES